MSGPLITLSDQYQPLLSEVTMVFVDQDDRPRRGFMVLNLVFPGGCETVLLESMHSPSEDGEEKHLVEVARSHGPPETHEEVVGRFLHREQAAEGEGTCPNGGDPSR